MISHVIYDDLKNIHSLYAEYVNKKLSSYSIKYYYKGTKIIYNNSLDDPHKFIIDVSIINSIRSIQRKFRRRSYVMILNEVNTVIRINDISQIVTSYLKKN
jgi:hypothetical protein